MQLSALSIYRKWTASCELKHCARIFRSLSTMAQPVSSQEVSIPNITVGRLQNKSGVNIAPNQMEIHFVLFFSKSKLLWEESSELPLNTTSRQIAEHLLFQLFMYYTWEVLRFPSAHRWQFTSDCVAEPTSHTFGDRRAQIQLECTSEVLNHSSFAQTCGRSTTDNAHRIDVLCINNRKKRHLLTTPTMPERSISLSHSGVRFVNVADSVV